MNKLSFVALGLLTMAALAGPVRAQANSCGCTQDPSSGACFCDKKARCGCPGECEPRGCQEQRDRELAKQVEIETRKAKEAARKHEPASQEDESEPVAKPAKSRPQPAATPKPVVQQVAQRNVRRLTSDQTKDLARLLSIYLRNRPDARSKTVEETYEELSIVP
jgi:hypothetical protein